MQMTSLLSSIHHLLFIFFIKLSYSSQSNPAFNLCPEIEKKSLLSFKRSLQDSGNLLSSWDGEVNCCKWEGVVCNNSTGHVSQLHLQSDNYWNEGYHLGGKINSFLSNLNHLTHLDLSSNNFSGETIPSFIGSLSSLEYLNLSYVGFVGNIPPNIGNLSNLHSLDLGSSYGWYNDQLESDNLEWLLGLSKLEYLNLNSADLSMARNWAEVINSLPCLLELHLSSCKIDPSQHHVMNNFSSTSLTLIDFSSNGYLYDHSFFPIPQWFFQLSNLLSLDLSFNSFSGQIPTLSNATKLQFLDLSLNPFNSTIPDWVYSCKDLVSLHLHESSIRGQISDSIGNLTSLETIDLRQNQVSGKLPREITNLCRLQTLDLSFNELQGELQDSFGNMHHCFLGSLRFLDLSHNQLTGHLTEQFGEFKVLSGLYLTNNSLSGTLPITLGNSSFLEFLQLNDNRFTGNLPMSLGQLSKMIEFNIENNRLEGIVGEIHFANLSKLLTFSASGNHLTLNVDTNWTPPIKIMNLGLGSWSLGVGSQIPPWLQTRRIIHTLDISNTGISGVPPSWFFDTWFLNISNNNLHGKIPYSNNLFGYMSHNNFSGSLPRIGNGMMHLDLSHNQFSEGFCDLLCDTTHQTYRLEFLVLDGNLLRGELPDCWEKWPYLRFLNVGNNKMFGLLPNSLGSLQYLMSLSLYGNKFSGQIPSSMCNYTSLLKLDLGHNNLDGNVPTWIGANLVNLKFLILRSNRFSGEVPWELCHLEYLQILDLSSNKLLGVIPKCLHNLTAMATKRVLSDGIGTQPELGLMRSYLAGVPIKESASVATKGLELEYTTILSLVTNIDLSSNHLSGEIPKELTSLVQLGSLNLSRNHLSGSIPESIGEMNQLESLDLSRNSLSGEIPKGLTLLSSLSFLNLSFNNLTGRIPLSTQLQTMDASRYVGNDLCGPPLARNCSSTDGDEAHGHKGEERNGEIQWMYVFLTLGYAVGFSSVCSVLVLKKSWRDAYFELSERMWDKLRFTCI